MTYRLVQLFVTRVREFGYNGLKACYLVITMFAHTQTFHRSVDQVSQILIMIYCFFSVNKPLQYGNREIRPQPSHLSWHAISCKRAHQPHLVRENEPAIPSGLHFHLQENIIFVWCVKT